ncbi:MAG: signal recognition particle-docking protein FtsY [Pseudonocardiaceae bacterium]|nr:MAG: signal recognition particle-docking protein FtsY [Pseudonocardiaceae bacterium]
MTTTLWIVVAVVAAALLIALVLGLVVSKRRRISLREPDQVEGGSTTEVKAPPRGGSYQASGGFSFSSGTATAPKPAEADEKAPETPAVEKPAAEKPADSAAPATPATPAAPPVPPTPTADDVRTPPGGIAAAGTATEARTPPEGFSAVPSGAPNEVPTPPRGTPAVATAPAAPAEPEPDTKAEPTSRDGAAAAAAGAAAAAAAAASTAAPVDEKPPVEAPGDGRAPSDGRAPAEAPADEKPPAEPVATAPPAPPVDAPGTVAPAAPTEEIAPTSGRLERLRGQLSRSRSAFGQSLLGLLGAGELDEDSWEDVEATLLQADLGPEMTAELVETLRTEIATRGVRTPDQARALLRDVLSKALDPSVDRSVAALPHDGRPAVLLVVGVNGTGKTTTTGKLARVLVADGRHVVLGAADTFRAAAAEQLATWGERAGAAVVRGPEGGDPASVAFDAVKRGTADGADAVLLDTAGRLHTKTGLMDELGKVKRVVEKQAEVDEVLLVLDATTGQNGLTQARVFGDVVKVTGIVLTKLDGTAKGGIVFRVQRELGVPVKLVGLGEGPDDLAPFEPTAFVDALLA